MHDGTLRDRAHALARCATSTPWSVLSQLGCCSWLQLQALSKFQREPARFAGSAAAGQQK